MTSQPIVRSLRDLNQLVPSQHAPAPGSTWTPEFPEPTSVEEAEDRYAVVAAEARSIQAQLSDRNKLNVFGRRMTDREFHQWRSKAVVALSAKQGQNALLKTWIRRRRHSIPATTTDYKVIRDAYFLLKTWWDGGDPDEALTQQTIARLENIYTRLAQGGASNLEVT